ncbi:MAG: transcriptional regulator [Sneathiella sp.]|uniref:helix-turn-helix domain-containing protein n=1 Tax=Sneathiella sp. TaxID=1964365 RepID=UPI000C4ABC50|nr:helix-turn-helix transcriptional regulator [Sneathiella sp.]MAZ03245.1 transcriptional regulator [Sneathiella sp.]
MMRILLKELVARKEFADKRKIRLDDLSLATGISKNTLSRMQSAQGYNTKTENLDKLCAYFDCRIEDLLEYIPEKVQK